MATFWQRAARLGLDIAFAPMGPEGAMDIFDSTLPLAPIAGIVSDQPSKTTVLSGHAVIAAIEAAVAATLDGGCRTLVTAPTHKIVLYQVCFRHPGHTEFLAALCAGSGKAKLSVMMLVHSRLRAVPVTIHIPIRDAPGLLSQRLIVDTVRVVAHDLRQRFSIANSQIAVTRLNPHAGEGGTIGHKDLEIVGPAVAQLQFEGYEVTGPLPADTLFYPTHWAQYDAVVAMYHDQALIQIKTVALEDAVNVTLALLIVRTSPDYDIAFDLAGIRQASPNSFLAAIAMADVMTANQ
ncbi:MAG: 4-hydroxythreonine-4-phosphate dehydrogenase PdxA [Candidatus Devosia symbiotica]|nr:4-hydroxythreonine-4-phosphate dehydrogenase PdxA [Candidatus Devosia symbiotica]